MSYYFCIVGTRDNPLYEADLAARSTASLGPSSFFSSSSTSSSSSASVSFGSNSGFIRNSASPAPSSSAHSSHADGSRSSLDSASTAPTDASGAAATGPGVSSPSSAGSVFGFGTALGALAGGLSGLASASALTQRGTVGATSGSGGVIGSGGTGSGGSGSQGRGLGFGRYNDKDVLQMIAHSSLDAVDDVQFFNGAMYIKNVDRINEWTTSAFLIPGNIKFLVLHEHKHEDGIRNFFIDVWELWTKITMNPFRELNDPIRNASFDHKVRAIARRYL